MKNMSTRMKSLAALSAALVLALVLALPNAARAQDRAVAGTVVAGTVVAENNQRPLGGAQITVVGAPGRGAVTDGGGTFRITGVTGTTVVLTVRLIGYRPVTDTVRVGTTNLRYALQERAVELNSFVIIGTAGGAQKKELGTSVATVNVADVVAQSSVPTVAGLLNGRAPGVAIIGTSGQIGAGTQIRVRGVGSFSLSSTPLIYVDGLRTNNGNTGLASRFNDIAPEEIESIEVLKGPAAATLYGTSAARGVINIITKRGTAGEARFTFTGSSGVNWFQNAAGRFPTNYWIPPGTDTLWSINFVKSEAAAGHPLFQDGGVNNYALSAAGGAGLYRYFVAGGLNSASGIVPYNSLVQKNVRTNLSIVPSSKVTIESSIGYISSKTSLAGEGGGAGPMWGVFAQPQRTLAACPVLYPVTVPRGCGWARGALTSPQEVTSATQNWVDLNRFTGSLSVKYEPFSWLSHRLIVGTDYNLEDQHSYRPYQTDSVIVFFLGANFDGARSQTTQQTTLNTYDYSGRVQFDVRPNVVSKTTFGVQYYTNYGVSLSASGTKFPTPGLSTITATGLKGAPTSNTSANNTLGFYGQQEFGLNDRLFVAAALRMDNNSAFGSKASFTTYPKLSASWVVSEEPRVRSKLPGFVNDLRLRAAFGGSGQQPGVNTALKTLSPVAGPGGATTLSNSTIGNLDLKPERVIGTELGFEAGLFNDRIGIDLTLFSDISYDAILASSVAPSTGFGASTQFKNAGQINKHGLELALKGPVISRRDYGWDMQFNIAAVTSKIIKMGGAGDTLINATGGNSAIGTVGDVFHRIGYSPFDLFSYRVVSATYDAATKKAINPMCDDGKGGVVECFVPGTSTLRAPLVYFGHTIPTTTGSWINTLRYGRFRLNVLVDWQIGHRKTNTNASQVCQALGACLEVLRPADYDPVIVAQAQNGGPLQGYFIRSAAFTKLREVALSYDAPTSLALRVGAKSFAVMLSGRNLATLTEYTGIDPEASVNGGGGSNNNFGTDQSVYPPLASVVVSFRLTY